MEKVTVIMDEHQLSRLGSASLTGIVTSELIERHGVVCPKEVEIELVFPQSSYEYRKKNGGPRDMIIWEHNVLCLTEDILSLQRDGFKITVKIITLDPT